MFIKSKYYLLNICPKQIHGFCLGSQHSGEKKQNKRKHKTIKKNPKKFFICLFETGKICCKAFQALYLPSVDGLFC